ncbi:MAG TPA: hypothetical protein PKN75_03990 [Bacteroidia bacterium]|nr:hypothetical protein [Bacteroidia bacterium]HNU32731.1 hypothetical protein [Bacteroidia bacterium]
MRSFWVTMVFFLLGLVAAVAQDVPLVRVNGIIKGDDAAIPVSNAMVVNKGTQQGVFAGAGNTFSVQIKKTDTLLVAATGYAMRRICFKDSVLKEVYNITVLLSKLSYEIKTVDIIPPRDLEQIQKDIETLGFKKEDYILTGVDAFNSPITFLYQAFSKRERAKRDIAEKRNDDKRRALLKELFRKYVDNNVITLNEEQFDAFIDYCGVSDEFLQNSSQYDFIVYVRKKFESYNRFNKK